MKILVELRDGVMLQIPFRESSKVYSDACSAESNLTLWTAELAMGW